MKYAILFLFSVLVSAPAIAAAPNQCTAFALKAAQDEVANEYPAVAAQTRYKQAVFKDQDGASGAEADITAFNPQISSTPEGPGLPSVGRFQISVPVDSYIFDDQGNVTSCVITGTATIILN